MMDHHALPLAEIVSEPSGVVGTTVWSLGFHSGKCDSATTR